MSVILYTIDYYPICKHHLMIFNCSLMIQFNLLESNYLSLILRDEDLNTNLFMRNAADTVEYLLNYCIFSEKS